MKAQISHRTKSQNHLLIVVSALALSMTGLMVTDMIRNRITHSASAAATVEPSIPNQLTSLSVGSNMLPLVEVVAPKLSATVAPELLPIENWMLTTESWLINQVEEPAVILQEWMFDYSAPSQSIEDTPALESWMYSMDGWIPSALADETVEIQSWMYDASNWL